MPIVDNRRAAHNRRVSPLAGVESATRSGPRLWPGPYRTFKESTMAKYGIGQALTRREDQRLLLGTGQYVDDVSVANEVFVAFVRSPHAHARIRAVDVSAAK